jgi:hypothetical protein
MQFQPELDAFGKLGGFHRRTALRIGDRLTGFDPHRVLEACEIACRQSNVKSVQGGFQGGVSRSNFGQHRHSKGQHQHAVPHFEPEGITEKIPGIAATHAREAASPGRYAVRHGDAGDIGPARLILFAFL